MCYMLIKHCVVCEKEVPRNQFQTEFHYGNVRFCSEECSKARLNIRNVVKFCIKRGIPLKKMLSFAEDITLASV